MSQEVERVLVKVASRQGLRSLGRATFLWTCVFGGVYAIALVGARVFELWADVFRAGHWLGTWSVALVPLFGLAVAWLTHRRGDLAVAARAADVHMDTKDLFLTSLQADRAPGEFQPLVEASARETSVRVRPDEIAPLTPFPRLAQAAGVLLALWAAAMYLPAVDLFGSEEERRDVQDRRESLLVQEEQTTRRKAALEKKPLAEKNSAEVSKALQEVVKTFREMQRLERDKNEQRLRKAQEAVGAKWREARAKSQTQGASSPRLQSLGKLADEQKFESWRRDLSSGKADSLRRELSELQELLKKIAESPDAAAREKLRKEIQERTKDLADFLKNNASSRELNESLSKALSQLQALATPQLAKDAQKALNQTLELSEMELRNLAQSLRDMKALEDTLKALQAARKANSEGCTGDGKGDKDGGQGGKDGKSGGKDGKDGKGDQPGEGLDGGQMPPLDGMKAYEEYYRKLLLEQGEGGGKGMGGPGRGEGGEAPENPDQKNDFKTEKALSALKAGKILMTLKTKEVGDKGEVSEKYENQLQQVKQGVGEAILQERVPPGYHEGIKRYFDQLGEKPAGKKK